MKTTIQEEEMLADDLTAATKRQLVARKIDGGFALWLSDFGQPDAQIGRSYATRRAFVRALGETLAMLPHVDQESALFVIERNLARPKL